MKNHILLFFAGILFASCTPVIKITGSWINPKPPQKSYYTILTTAMTSDVIAKSRLENDLAVAFSKHGYKIIKGIEEFPPGLSNDSVQKTALIAKVKEKNIDAILTVTLLKKETDTRYIPGQCIYPPPMLFVHYHNFWGYYNYWSPCVYTPGYYIRDEIYYIETNLYDSGSEELLWSAQSETYYPASLNSFSKEFANSIVERLIKDGALRQPKPTVSK